MLAYFLDAKYLASHKPDHALRWEDLATAATNLPASEGGRAAKKFLDWLSDSRQ
jgi:hypothetical protein